MDVNVGLLGMGNVGTGVAEYLSRHGQGMGLELRAAAVRDPAKKRSVAVPYTTDAYDIIRDRDVHIVVELVGGEYPALDYVMEAINNGKCVVTANKLILAKHGREIFGAARARGVDVGFEASVGGGIPIIQALREDLAANNIYEITGIVNGTTNYMLTRMGENMNYDAALLAAQEKGFAEADPFSDVSGQDSRYKLTILASVAWNADIDYNSVPCEGITGLTQQDIDYADAVGYTIKLLATARKHNDTAELRVNPALIRNEHPLANVMDENNAIHVRGSLCGPQMYYGKGAGRGPTTSAVLADVMRIARNIRSGVGDESPSLDRRITLLEDPVSAGYIRADLRHVPGALHAVSGILARNGISIKDSLQREKFGYEIDGQRVIPDIITTEPVRDSFVKRALEELAHCDMVHGTPYYLRIEA